eukprot:628241-Prymnesium_polylepis.1
MVRSRAGPTPVWRRCGRAVRPRPRSVRSARDERRLGLEEGGHPGDGRRRLLLGPRRHIR